jgi:hypothetical protein
MSHEQAAYDDLYDGIIMDVKFPIHMPLPIMSAELQTSDD